MSGRRLIGVDLAWSERNGTGCVELVWDGDELELSRVELCGSLEEIVEWIEPERGDWVAAVDAPLVVRNWTGMRAADREVSRWYGRFEAGAYPASLELLGAEHRGGQLLGALRARGAGLVEEAGDVGGGRLVFETYPHVVMVELFGLERTIKYKKKSKRSVAQMRRGQRELAGAIREWLCGAGADPRLRVGDGLEALLEEPEPVLRGGGLKGREDRLDGLVCAYLAGWVDGGRPWQGFGEVGKGVMVVPAVRGIGGV